MAGEPIVVRVEQVRRGCGCGGCFTFIAVLAAIGLLVTYWQVTLAVAGAAALIGGLVWWHQRAQEPQPPANRGVLWSGASPHRPRPARDAANRSPRHSAPTVAP